MNIFKDKNNVTDEARLRLFNAKVITGVTNFKRTLLPPTSAAASELSLRVNHQVEMWLENDLKPTDLGLKLVKGQYVLVTTQLPAAPSEILEIIYCNCKGAANTTNVAV